MTRDSRQPRRRAAIALGLIAILGGCGEPSATETGPEPPASSTPSTDQDNAGAPLEGLAFEVHRDPG